MSSALFADDNCLVMGTVDSYGHLIVSRLDAVGSGMSIMFVGFVIIGFMYELIHFSSMRDMLYN